MSTYGLQCWDSAGRKTLDIDTSVAKFLGTLSFGTSYTGATVSGSITDSRFTAYAGHKPFFTRIDGAFSNEGYDAEVVISGNTLTWTYPNSSTTNYSGTYLYRPNQTIIYGIY